MHHAVAVELVPQAHAGGGDGGGGVAAQEVAERRVFPEPAVEREEVAPVGLAGVQVEEPTAVQPGECEPRAASVAGVRVGGGYQLRKGVATRMA